MTYIEQIAQEIADIISPPRDTGNGVIVSGRNPLVKNLLIDMAKEIHRAAIEGEF